MKGVLSPKLAGVLGRAPFAYLAVETSSGPHVTPLLFGVTAPNRLWFGIGRRTLKARALAKRPAVGVVVPGEEASVAIRGEATLLDGLPSPSVAALQAPLAFPAFALRNARELAAFGRDVVTAGAQPQVLVAVSVRIDSIELCDGWPAAAVLGWSTPSGPVALPARWRADAARAVVPSGLLRTAGGARSAPACLCVDQSNGAGPLAKRGTLLRGTGQARLRGQVATVDLAADRVTRWRGFETRTSPVG